MLRALQKRCACLGRVWPGIVRVPRRWVLFAAVTGAVVALATSTAASAASLAGSSGTGSSHVAAVLSDVSNASNASSCKPAAPRRGSGSGCLEFTVVPLRRLSAEAVTRLRDALLASRKPPKTKRRTSVPAQGIIVPPIQCGFLEGTVVSNPDRFTSCYGTTITAVFTIPTPEGPIPAGTFVFQDVQWASYSATSSTWTHGMVIMADDGSGELIDGFEAFVRSGCDLQPLICSATSLTEPDPQIVPIQPGGVYNFEWRETDRGPASTTRNKIDLLDQYLGVHIFGQAGRATGELPLLNVLKGRCDSVVTAKDGCVNERFTPTLSLSLAKYGAATAMIKWAQLNLSGHWGLRGVGQALHRLIGGKRNRYVICRRGWKSNPAITKALAPFKDKDSCDEFPFASSFESGAMAIGANGKPKPHVNSGAACVQVTAVMSAAPTGASEATVWHGITVSGHPSRTDPCIRGHVPNKLNGGVGVAYSVLIRTQRLVNKDAFWLAVVS
jgi:hypothetical protein